MDKTLAGADFNVYRVGNSARGLGMVPCLDIFGTRKIIIHIFTVLNLRAEKK